jgi:hypothetical protein
VIPFQETFGVWLFWRAFEQPVEKMQYLGGACYFCPKCQV